jgi:hypothetical protein
MATSRALVEMPIDEARSGLPFTDRNDRPNGE